MDQSIIDQAIDDVFEFNVEIGSFLCIEEKGAG